MRPNGQIELRQEEGQRVGAGWGVWWGAAIDRIAARAHVVFTDEPFLPCLERMHESTLSVRTARAKNVCPVRKTEKNVFSSKTDDGSAYFIADGSRLGELLLRLR